MTEKQIERRLRKIDSLKSTLKKEKAKFGWYDDSYGRRYSIAELYFEIKDFRKTNAYLNWFNKNFSDDVTYPFFQLNSAQTYFYVNKKEEAYESIVKLNCLNLYLVDLLNDKLVQELEIPKWSESESLQWAQKHCEIYRKNLSDKFLTWTEKVSCSIEYKAMKNRYIAILKLINYSEDLNQRKELFDAKRQCEKDWIQTKRITTHKKGL